MNSDDNKPEDESGEDEPYHFGSFKKLNFDTFDIDASKNEWNTNYLIAST